MLFCAVPTRRKRPTERSNKRGRGEWQGHGPGQDISRLEGRKLQLGCDPARPLFIYLWAFYTASSAQRTARQNSAQPQAAASNIMQISLSLSSASASSSCFFGNFATTHPTWHRAIAGVQFRVPFRCPCTEHSKVACLCDGCCRARRVQKFNCCFVVAAAVGGVLVNAAFVSA